MTNLEGNAGRGIHVENAEQAVPVIVTYVTTAIAGAGIPAHDVDAVCTQMTSDKALDTIRASYGYRTKIMGDTPKEACVSIGVRLIQAYRAKYGV